MEQINYVPLVPKEPPTDLVAEVIRQGGFKKNYLIYRSGWAYEPLEDRKVPCVDVACSACKETFKVDRADVGACARAMAPAPFGWYHPNLPEAVISGVHTQCPICGAEAETIHVSNMRPWKEDYEYVTVLSRLPVEGKQDRLVLTEWQIRRDTDKSGEQAFGCNIWTAWVVEDKKVVRLMGHYRNFNRLIPIALTQKTTFLDNYGELRWMYPYQADILAGTTAENSKLDMYIEAGGKCLVAYLALWRRKPQVENLVMQGLGQLVEELIDRDQTSHSYERHKGIPRLENINWKSKKPHEMLHMKKWQLRQVRETLKKDGVDCLKWAADNGVEMERPEQMEWILKQHPRTLNDLKSEVPDFWRAAKYLMRDKSREVGTLIDYWEMAKKIRMDLDVERVRFPKDLKWSHDNAVRLYNEQKDTEASALSLEKFRERENALMDYAWEANGILIRPCATEKELRAEGRTLNHCVGTYANGHVQGKTAIFFVRKVETLDVPWFTLQLDEKEMKILQNRGENNCDPPEDEKAFVDLWIKWAREVKMKGENAA